MGKKLFFYVFNLIIPAIIFGVLLFWGYSKIGGFDPDIYVRDIALSINTMNAVDGDVNVLYSIEKDVDVSLKEGYVIMNYKELEYKYPYFENKKFKIDLFKDEGKLIIKKSRI